MGNKILLIVLGVLFAVTLSMSVYTITKNNALSENLAIMQSETQKLSLDLQNNRDKLNNVEVQKDKLSAVLNKVSPWLDKDYYDSVIGTKLDSETKSLFPAPPEITPRALDNKLSLLIQALQDKNITDKKASQKTIDKIDELKKPIMDEISKVFDAFEKIRSDFSTVNNINQKLYKEKEELIVSNNQKVEQLNTEIAKLKEETGNKLLTIEQNYQTQKSDLIKKYEQRITGLKDSTNVVMNSVKEQMHHEKGLIKEDLNKKLSQLQDLMAELNTLAEKSFDSYYQMKKKSFTGIFFSNKKMLTDLEKEKDDFYSRFSQVKDASEKIFGIAKQGSAASEQK
ncbi:MAG: hypothetical protein HY934_08870 [Candidatus Firestonebacteria bacterium]|nr:hypothetical protein [Candidatus Firestonebacteria bacterium]